MTEKIKEKDIKYINPILDDMFNKKFTFVSNAFSEAGYFYAIHNKEIITVYYDKTDKGCYLEIYSSKNIFNDIINIAENNLKYGVISDICSEDRLFIFVLYNDLKNIDI